MEGLGGNEMQALADLLCPESAEVGGASVNLQEKHKSRAKANVKIQAKVENP